MLAYDQTIFPDQHSGSGRGRGLETDKDSVDFCNRHSISNLGSNEPGLSKNYGDAKIHGI
jgi:hypothetical protein